MSAGFKFVRLAGVFLLCLASLNTAHADSTHSQRKAKKPVLPPLPSGPTGPVPQMPLDSIAPVPPQVSYQDGQLTIVAPNSTLGDILRAVHKQTGAEIDIPDAKERVAMHLGPGPARDVMAELLNGSRFNYVLLGSPSDANALTRVVLVAKTGPDNPSAVNQPAQPSPQAMNQARMAQPQDAAEANDADAAEENADDSADQAPAEAEQPAAPPADQPGVKTPQQMLQEMQQRQLQLQQQQQQQQTGQPGPGIPPRPQQEQ